MADETEAEKKGRRAGRSPAYPFIPVQKAVEQARALYDQENEYFAPLPAAFGAWGYGPKSSGARQTLATLKYYGLIDVQGDGDARKVKVSEIARRIILDQREDDTEKRRLIREVALMPSAHKALYKAYPSGLPSDSNVTHFLIFDLNYNKEAARDLLAEYKETASYAGLYQPQKPVDKTDDEDDTGDTQNELKPEDKDLEAQAAAATAAAQRAAEQAAQKQPPAGTRRAVFDLTEGEVVITYPADLTPESVSDLQDYINVFMKKARREAGVQ
jgi:hypothetical protein